MCLNTNLTNAERKQDELEMVMRWKVIPKLNVDTEYRITIAYTTTSGNETIKVLGSYFGSQVHLKIIKFFNKFLQEVESFGLLVEANDSDEVHNWDISFSRDKKKEQDDK